LAISLTRKDETRQERLTRGKNLLIAYYEHLQITDVQSIETIVPEPKNMSFLNVFKDVHSILTLDINSEN